ncbi:MAG TPA: archaeosortase/exosortase family protein, partial [Paludibacteraceae bacterium]|nr:archaeosortase/exosortase family protein [Paludibacteraceae bacterium]
YIFTCIILFSRGSWKHKAWFIPAGVLVCFLINIVRIIILVVVIENHQAIFKVLHESVLKYIFYGIIFLMWVLWEEKIATVNLSSEETEKQT